MRGLPISSSNPMRLLLLISPDTAAKRQGWGLVTHPRDPAPIMTQTTKLPCLPVKLILCATCRRFCDGYNLIISQLITHHS